MSTNKPDGYVNATDMAHPTDRGASNDGCGRPGERSTARAVITAEQEAKRTEKIRSHASSHQTAGTVKLDT